LGMGQGKCGRGEPRENTILGMVKASKRRPKSRCVGNELLRDEREGGESEENRALTDLQCATDQAFAEDPSDGSLHRRTTTKDKAQGAPKRTAVEHQRCARRNGQKREWPSGGRKEHREERKKSILNPCKSAVWAVHKVGVHSPGGELERGYVNKKIV